VNYLVKLSPECDQHLQQMCKQGSDGDGENAVTPERFLSAFIEVEICRLFSVSRPLPKNGKTPTAPTRPAVGSTKQQTRHWQEAAAATRVALESLRKLVEHASS
jgi:hypothetical protein